jgi:dihydrofolate reductase
MRKVVLFVHMSLDGYAAGPNGELDWISFDDELQEYALEIESNVGSPLYGRVTYQLMESYWPTVLTDPSSNEKDRAHAQWLEDVTKIVFSNTLKEVSWKNSILIQDNIASEIEKLKQQPGKDLVIYGSPGFAQTLMQLDLIDEYRLTVNPVILGNGKLLFTKTLNMARLELLQSKTFNSDVVALFYRTKKA